MLPLAGASRGRSNPIGTWFNHTHASSLIDPSAKYAGTWVLSQARNQVYDVFAFVTEELLQTEPMKSKLFSVNCDLFTTSFLAIGFWR